MAGTSTPRIDALRERLDGSVLTPGEPLYEEGLLINNGAIDFRPLAIAKVDGVGDVQAALAWARDEGVSVSVRGGGHGVHGLAIRNGGLAIDMRGMADVKVDPEARQARVGGGALWAAVYGAAAEHELTPVGGTVTSVGVVGFTIGSGNAWLMRRHGLACDNVVSFELVTADGEFRRVDPTTDGDLFWALKGGGGNFGVVTSITLRLHPVPRRVLGGIVFYDCADAPRTLRGYVEAIERSPRDLAAMWAVAQMPDAPEVPEVLRGRPVVALLTFFVGDLADAEAALAPFRSLAPSLLDGVAETDFVEAISMLDDLAPHGLLNHWRGGYLREVSDELIEALPEALNTPELAIQIWRMGAAVDDAPLESSAVPRDRRRFFVGVASIWADQTQSERVIAATDAAAAVFAPWWSGTCPNHAGQMSQEELRDALGTAIFERLRTVKQKVDPDNVFSANQNVEP